MIAAAPAEARQEKTREAELLLTGSFEALADASAYVPADERARWSRRTAAWLARLYAMGAGRRDRAL